MSGWTHINGRVVALDQANVDTDQLIPARFMSQPRSGGYADFLLHDARENDAAHILNTYTPDVLISQRNFGSGSSREAAVYALVDFGIRAVFAPSFGDIFSANAVNNGLLPARVSQDNIDALIASLGSGDGAAQVDLTAGHATLNGHTLQFKLQPVWQQKLINGWDDIDLTAQYQRHIDDFHVARTDKYPWAMPAA